MLIFACCVRNAFLCLNTDYLCTNYIFNLIDIYIFIPASGCISSRLGVLLCPGPYNAVKTAWPTDEVKKNPHNTRNPQIYFFIPVNFHI
jgi:hypothetical protein